MEKKENLDKKVSKIRGDIINKKSKKLNRELNIIRNSDINENITTEDTNKEIPHPSNMDGRLPADEEEWTLVTHKKNRPKQRAPNRGERVYDYEYNTPRDRHDQYGYRQQTNQFRWGRERHNHTPNNRGQWGYHRRFRQGNNGATNNNDQNEEFRYSRELNQSNLHRPHYHRENFYSPRWNRYNRFIYGHNQYPRWRNNDRPIYENDYAQEEGRRHYGVGYGEDPYTPNNYMKTQYHHNHNHHFYNSNDYRRQHQGYKNTPNTNRERPSDKIPNRATAQQEPRQANMTPMNKVVSRNLDDTLTASTSGHRFLEEHQITTKELERTSVKRKNLNIDEFQNPMEKRKTIEEKGAEGE
ncbi:GATA zinc finger domain-containing protein 14-like [Bombina bombina]|uniref:GATA zinc finger domain-containing protein 14-like n=1 Tax=Bombina bombina TaxID=8345 RepID=UPI00235AB543|nr:GATA zinc finger domain-containing protein 14-like [Bombina bombina]